MIQRRYLKALGLLAAAGAGASVMSACEGRSPSSHAASDPAASSAGSPASPPASSSGVVAELDFTRGVPEEVSTPLFGSAPRRSHLDLARVLSSLESSPSRGIFIRLGSATLGLSGAQEVGARLGALRKRGIPVVCHADGYDNASLLLAASGCSRIWVSPAGGVDSVGLSAQLIYARSLLDRLHVSVDFLQIGKYKGAEEPFTRDGPSPEARETLVGALRGMRTAWLDGITQGRGKPDLAAVVEDGPFTPEDALAKGLIDAVGYADEARDDTKKLTGVDQLTTRFGSPEGSPPASRGLVGILRSLGGSGSGGAPHIAVVPAIGPISMGGTPSLPFGGGGGISEQELGRVLTRLGKEASVKAVVIRLDSPGGSALASDLLWKRLMDLREKKPLVFSIGSMAASGGYYMASTATKIVADPTSLIGSIGVVGGKLAVGKALEEIGVHAETISASPDPGSAARASYLSPFTPWDAPTREKVRATMTSVYDLFLRRVAEGRKTTVDKVAPFAEGRVFGGVEAKERGMIDELGGFQEALALAQKLAGLPEDTPFEVTGDGDGGLLDLLDTGDASASGGGDSKAEGAARRVAQEALVPEWTGAMPAVGAFVGSMTPFLRGERTLAALPFG
ncbi:MAG: S49 family peptidase, partial [Byssovorax sp.]